MCSTLLPLGTRTNHTRRVFLSHGTLIMKKILLLSALFLAVSAVGMGANGKDKKKKQQQSAAQQPLVTAQDSLSYAAGLAATNGLLPFLQQEYDMDAAQMAEFVAGYQDALRQIDSPQFKARHAGAAIARMVKNRILPQATGEFKGTASEINTEIFNQGFLAGVQNDTTVYSMEAATELYQAQKNAVKETKNKEYIAANTAWLKENATKPGVKTTASGLQYKVITQGKGDIPKKEDKVTVKYEGKTIDGNVFDSSYKRNPQTTSFRCDQVIKGWTEALTMMPVGSKWELYIPQELAYGERQAGQIQPYSALIFTVELIGIDSPSTSATK